MFSLYSSSPVAIRDPCRLAVPKQIVPQHHIVDGAGFLLAAVPETLQDRNASIRHSNRGRLRFPPVSAFGWDL